MLRGDLGGKHQTLLLPIFSHRPPRRDTLPPGLPFCAQEGDGYPFLHTRLAWSPRSHFPPWSNRKAWENAGSLTASGTKTSPNKGPFLKHSCSLRGMPGQGRLPLLPASQQGQAFRIHSGKSYPVSVLSEAQATGLMGTSSTLQHSAGRPGLVWGSCSHSGASYKFSDYPEGSCSLLGSGQPSLSQFWSPQI